MKQHFLKLHRYESWANHKILKSVKEYSPNDQQILRIFSHILAAQTIWSQRILEQPSLQNVWQVLGIEECEIQLIENEKLLNSLLLEIEDFHRKIIYQNTKGESFSNSVSDILTHLFNHSSYHRGQIVFCLKNYTQDLPVTDLIFYLRENNEKTR